MAASLLQLRGITKRFPGVLALDGVDFALTAGEVHALVGENGAGKSTLIKIISGVHQPDAGRIDYLGTPVTFPTPRAAADRGITVIYQEVALFPDLTVLENLYVGAYPRRPLLRHSGRGRRVDWMAMRARAQDVAASLGVKLDLEAPVHRLSAAQQQLVEIARALLRDARVIIMDEPTGPLTQQDAARLFSLIRQLRSRGVGIIYISHRLEEIFEVADRLTVLRDGRRIVAMPVGETTREMLIHHMVGRTLDTLYPHTARQTGPPVLEVEGLGTSGALTDVSFTLGRGEILGLAGLVGSGRTTLARAIFGIVPPGRGRIKLDGVDARIAHAGRARELGIAYVPEERQRQGLVLPFSVSENLSLVILRRLSRLGFINHASERTVAHDVVRRLDIRTPGIGVPAATLSGGNQQKVVVGKWLAAQPRVLIMDEPTRGVDVGAKAEIHRLMSELAGRGLAILLISSELPELLGMSDRIMVMHRGRIAGELSRDQATQEKIMAMATGVA
ncbi:MAG: sugar ABC transporter ATP-binding protein [Bacillati bacterium ANGP1]|uniref:Sugar ABC transporter ATP-binding protein n=1 Tax=Candidatus Segetimicrobium genomatis TaxID=2569760 RepID=A0A537LFX4_9BACT|nr:MAG: sugar ABC transporter ATP-binding protein [Terrabacteria group bacterium ANGP1]